LVVVVKNRAGMIWSVSTLVERSPRSSNAPAEEAPLQELPRIGDPALHGGGGGGHGTHQQGSRSHALASFEISVAGAHEYCPAPTVSPFIPSTSNIRTRASRHPRPENLCQPQAFRVALDLLRTGTMSSLTPAATLRPFKMLAAALRSSSRHCAASDEHHVDGFAQHDFAAMEPHVSERLVVHRIAEIRGMAPPKGITMPGLCRR